jgi:Skp family chaperone for outer membrane proteins
MKKITFLLVASVLAITAAAQNEKYIKAMEAKVQVVESTRDVEGLRNLANTFERIADAEKTQWQPYYYAALAQVNTGLYISNGQMGGLADKLDPIANKAEELINKAEALSKDNAEVYIVKKMIATLRMMGDPMNRYMQYGPQAQQALETARKLDPNNPRVYLLEGQDKFYTPEQYGGSKVEAKRLFEEALKKFDTFKPATTIDPSWGRGTTQYFLSQIK